MEHLRNCAPFGTNYLWRGECRILISILVCWWRIWQGLREPAGTEGTVCNGPNHLSDYKICFICLNATQPEDVLTARQCPGTAPGNPLPPGSRANCPWTEVIHSPKTYTCIFLSFISKFITMSVFRVLLEQQEMQWHDSDLVVLSDNTGVLCGDLDFFPWVHKKQWPSFLPGLWPL